MDRDEPVFEEIEMGDGEYIDTYYGQPLERLNVQNQIGNKSENI